MGAGILNERRTAKVADLEIAVRFERTMEELGAKLCTAGPIGSAHAII